MDETKPYMKEWELIKSAAASLDDPRPSRHEYFMGMARKASELATCPRAHVGAVLVRGKRIIATGYNGVAPELPHCTEVGCDLEHGHDVGVIHAEENIIIQCAAEGISSKDAVCYCTMQPCVRCATRLYAAGVKAVYWEDSYATMGELDAARLSKLIRRGFVIKSMETLREEHPRQFSQQGR